MRRSLPWLVLVTALFGTGTFGCSEEKEKGSKAKVTAASGDCARCEREKSILASKLKSTKNQLNKLKKQLNKAKRKKKRAPKPAASAPSK
jgi:hypothetical protein